VAGKIEDDMLREDNDLRTRVINAAAEGRAISKALASLLRKAQAAGCVNPALFFEAESAAVFVLDRDHPGYKAERAHDRQQAIVVRACIRTPFDTGAW
jgi:hypothetical protein